MPRMKVKPLLPFSEPNPMQKKKKKKKKKQCWGSGEKEYLLPWLNNHIQRCHFPQELWKVFYLRGGGSI